MAIGGVGRARRARWRDDDDIATPLARRGLFRRRAPVPLPQQLMASSALPDFSA